MATLMQIAPSTWQATFNRQEWRIRQNRNQLTVFRLAHGAEELAPVNVEVHSLMRFWRYCVDRKITELPTLYALADGARRED